MPGYAYLSGMFGLVTAGTIVPVLPSGAPLSAAAALAGRDDLLVILVVFAVGAAAAYVGDLVTYAVLRIGTRRTTDGTGRFSRWLQKQQHGGVVQHAEQRLESHERRTLLLSRLVPGGRLPVLLSAAIGAYPWRRYAVADIAAAALWSAVYTASGLAGRAVFSKPWEGVAASIALVLLISLSSSLWTRFGAGLTGRQRS